MALTDLECHDNQIRDLDLSNNSLLNYVYCQGNQIENLRVSDESIFSVLYLDEGTIRGSIPICFNRCTIASVPRYGIDGNGQYGDAMYFNVYIDALNKEIECCADLNADMLSSDGYEIIASCGLGDRGFNCKFILEFKDGKCHLVAVDDSFVKGCGGMLTAFNGEYNSYEFEISLFGKDLTSNSVRNLNLYSATVYSDNESSFETYVGYRLADIYDCIGINKSSIFSSRLVQGNGNVVYVTGMEPYNSLFIVYKEDDRVKIGIAAGVDDGINYIEDVVSFEWSEK